MKKTTQVPPAQPRPKPDNSIHVDRIGLKWLAVRIRDGKILASEKTEQMARSCGEIRAQLL